MSITYKMEIDNSKIEDFSEFIEKVFVSVMELGRTVKRAELKKKQPSLLS